VSWEPRKKLAEKSHQAAIKEEGRNRKIGCGEQLTLLDRAADDLLGLTRTRLIQRAVTCPIAPTCSHICEFVSSAAGVCGFHAELRRNARLYVES
jgi:hypothetical protein